MPLRNRIKVYRAGGVYHIYNRGIEGREIFKSDEDYLVFVGLLKRYLEKVGEGEVSKFDKERPYIRRHKQAMNLHTEVKLLAYCLMPDHIHLIVKQETSDGMTKLVRRLMTNYVMWFNKKYKRRGVLFESAYRAVLVPFGEKLLVLSRYIHLNPAPRVVRRFGPVETVAANTPEYYAFSSYQNYLGNKNDEWVCIDEILQELVKLVPNLSYRQFVEGGEEMEGGEINSLIVE
jgi:putative transposase